MQKNIVYFIIGIVVIVLILGVGLFLLNTGTQTPKSISQHCQYHITIHADNPIRNITFILPLPVRNGTPRVMNKELTPALLAENSVDTIWINGTSLKSRPSLEYTFLAINGTQLVEVRGGPDDTISSFSTGMVEDEKVADSTAVNEFQKTLNTLTPQRNSSVFAPEEGCFPVTATSCSYTLPVYVSFDGDPLTNVMIISSVSCRNEWWGGYSWISNSYNDHYEFKVRGPVHKWYSVKGNLTAGQGIYK